MNHGRCKRRSVYMYPIPDQIIRLIQVELIKRGDPGLGTSYAFACNLAVMLLLYRGINIRAPEADRRIAEQLNLWMKGRINPSAEDLEKFREIIEAMVKAQE